MQPKSLSSIAGVTFAFSLARAAQAQAPAEPLPPPTLAPSPVTPPPASEPPKSPEPPKPEDNVLGKWAPKLYGFVQLNAIEDTTQSFNVQAGNAVIAKPGTYAGEHGRLTLSGQHTRLGLKWKTPGNSDVRALANIEVDFLGPFPPGTTEIAVLTQPFLRMRHAYFKVETPIVDLTMGQTWELIGWQSFFHPTSVEIQGVPAEVYTRTPQIRLSHTFKSEAANFDIAGGAFRPPQRDSAVPDLQAGLKLTINGWKGVRTLGATVTQTDALAFGVSGALRWFKVDDFSAKPTHEVTTTGWAVSGDVFVPIIPGSAEDRGNSLALTGSFVSGAADDDLYSGLNGGITFPALPNPTMAAIPPTFTPDIDTGLVAFNSTGDLQAIKWWSFIVGLQYYLPPSGKVWIAGNYSHMHSTNIASLGNPANVFDTSNWLDGNLFWDATDYIRFGVEYEWFQQIYGDDVKAPNSRFQLAGWFLF